MMQSIIVRRTAALAVKRPLVFRRCLTTLDSNPYLYVMSHPSNSATRLITLLPTNPPTAELALGESNEIPPTPRSFRENPKFQQILHSVIAENAHADPQLQGQAASMASSSGALLMQPNRRSRAGSAGASDQGGAGSGGQGGWVHVSDNRHPPDYGRIAEPEDIFGSVEVDGSGKFVDGHGRYQQSGTYRMCTRDGLLQLPDFLRQKLIERLRLEEAAIKN